MMRARQLSSIAAALSVLGFVFGISNTAVTPPITAARLPVSRSSLWVRPGSRNGPGVDHAGEDVEPVAVDPPARIGRLPGATSATMRPSVTPTEASTGPPGVWTVPPRGAGRTSWGHPFVAFTVRAEAFAGAAPSYLGDMNETSPGMLADRAVLRVAGDDVRGFLQGW